MNAIGIDLGGTNVKGVLMNDQGEILAQESKSGQDNKGLSWKDAVKAVFTSIKEVSGAPVTVGLAAPGLPDETNRKIVYMPGRLDGLEHFDWTDFLGQEVVVLNDAHAALMAEAKLGAALGLKHVVMLTLGTGVGGAILIDGKLYQGMYQRAGSIGDISLHAESEEIGLTGMPGSLEDAIGNDTISRRTSGKFNSTLDVVEAYQRGDVLATQVWTTSVRKLAVGVCSLINVLSPQVVVLGGGIAQAGDALFQPLGAFMERYEMRPNGKSTPVVKAKFNEFSGAIGAACFALEGNLLNK